MEASVVTKEQILQRLRASAGPILDCGVERLELFGSFARDEGGPGSDDYILTRSRGPDKEGFLADETLRRAFVRSLEVIGEAAKRVPVETTEKTRELDWRGMAGMRDRLIHGYFGVDYELL